MQLKEGIHAQLWHRAWAGAACQQQAHTPFKQHQGLWEELLRGGVLGTIIRAASHREPTMYQAGHVLSELPEVHLFNPHNTPMKQL